MQFSCKQGQQLTLGVNKFCVALYQISPGQLLNRSKIPGFIRTKLALILSLQYFSKKYTIF